MSLALTRAHSVCTRYLCARNVTMLKVHMLPPCAVSKGANAQITNARNEKFARVHMFRLLVTSPRSKWPLRLASTECTANGVLPFGCSPPHVRSSARLVCVQCQLGVWSAGVELARAHNSVFACTHVICTHPSKVVRARFLPYEHVRPPPRISERTKWCMHARKHHKHRHRDMDTHMHAQTCIKTGTHTCICANMYQDMDKHMHAQTCIKTWTHTHAYAQTCAHIHTQT